jgi:hypothetical protein
MFLENFCYKRVTDENQPCCTELIPEGGKIVAAVLGVVDAATAVPYGGHEPGSICQCQGAAQPVLHWGKVIAV